MGGASKHPTRPGRIRSASRGRILLLSLALVAAGAAVIGATLAARSGDDKPAAEVSEVSSSGAIAPDSPFRGALRPPAPAKGFTLKDQAGNRVSLAAERGRVVVLSPMYTTCRTTCPLIAQQIAARARRFLRQRRVHGRIDFLLGSRAALRPLWRAYGFAPQGKRSEHNSYAVLIDRRGRARVGFQASFLTPEALAHDIRVLLEA
jgi:cytochrome oxidase Cu insertion factor (SCO1/SenC/PrrC family)